MASHGNYRLEIRGRVDSLGFSRAGTSNLICKSQRLTIRDSRRAAENSMAAKDGCCRVI